MSTFAIVETGSKQYWIEPDSVIEVEKLSISPDTKIVELENVLFYKDGDNVRIGQPTVEGAKVICENLGEMKGKKVISFKFRRRKASRNIKGHRQTYSHLRVKEIKV